MVYVYTYSSCYISLVTAKLFVLIVVFSALVKCPSLQDGKAIEHQTTPSDAIYAEVDKPQRGSSKKREPDVVPPGSRGVSQCLPINLAVDP